MTPDNGVRSSSSPGQEQSTYFLSTNRNKRSVVLDLRASEDFRTLRALLKRADVLIENFGPASWTASGCPQMFFASSTRSRRSRHVVG